MIFYHSDHKCKQLYSLHKAMRTKNTIINIYVYLFMYANCPYYSTELRIDNCKISTAHQYEYLGMVLDDRLL